MSATTAPRRRQRGASTTWVVLALSVVGIGAFGLWSSASGDVTAVDPDQVVTVEIRDLLDAVNATGRVEPLARVAVMSRASGILEELLVEEGDPVTAGQVLAELDREQLLAQLDRDRANLASAQARLNAAKARYEEARVRLEDPELDFARREAERLQALFASGDLSEKELEDARRVLAGVEFRIAQTEASLPVLAAAVDEAEANLRSTTASVEQSETALREATIRSPIDGVVLQRLKEVGDGVSSILTAGGNATQVMLLGDLSEMYVEAMVDEVDLGRIGVDQPVRVTVDAHRGRVLTGRVERIAPSGTVDNNGIVTFKVRVTVDDPDGLLKPDMTADCKLVLEEVSGVPSLPQRAFVKGADGEWVARRVVDGEPPRVERTVVSLGVSDGLMTQITGGLSAGDSVELPSISTAGRP